ncbi:MAG TPA: rhodanese-like domain-containing protein, partial [Candidatus Acidoferrales bacterium]
QPEAPAIRLEEAYRAFLGGEVLFVDVREPDAFRAGHIRGARNIPLGQVERRLNDLPRDQRIVLYDDDPGGGDACAASRSASRLFLSRGYSPSLVRVYRDGFTRWREAGYPTEQ